MKKSYPQFANLSYPPYPPFLIFTRKFLVKTIGLETVIHKLSTKLSTRDHFTLKLSTISTISTIKLSTIQMFTNLIVDN